MYHVASYFTVPAERRQDFINAALENRRDSLANELGTKRFELIEGGANDRFYLNEAYEDAAAFATHKQGPHFRKFFDAMRKFGIEKPIELISGTQIESKRQQAYFIDPGKEQEPADPEKNHFIGRVRLQRLGDTAVPTGVEVVVVFFEAGARTRPHIHPTDQVLHFISGRGFVAFPEQEEHEIEEGGIFIVPAGTLHMHGATSGGGMRHLAVRGAGKTDWDPALPAAWRSWGK